MKKEKKHMENAYPAVSKEEDVRKKLQDPAMRSEKELSDIPDTESTDTLLRGSDVCGDAAKLPNVADKSEKEVLGRKGEDAALSAEEAALEPSECDETKEGKRKCRIFTVKIFNYKLIYLFIMCIIMSFIGFLVENLFRLFRDGVINSRRQILPFLFAYGIAVFVMYVVIGTPREMRFFCWRLFKKNSKLTAAGKYVCYFLIVMAFIFFGEMMFGTFVEWASGVVLWDYTGIPLRFTKYTSIPTALGLTFGITLFMRFIFEPLMHKLEKIPEKVALGIDIGLGIPIVLDWILMLVLMLGYGISENWWNINVW